MNRRTEPTSLLRRGLGGWLPKAVLVVLWALALGLLAGRLGLPDSPAGPWAALIGLDRPGGWWAFIGHLTPLGLLLMSLVGHLLARWAGPAAAQRGARLWAWDWLAYLCLPLMLILSAAHAWLGPWALACGALYLLALAWQTGLAASLLWEAGGRADAPPRLAAWGSAFIALALYWALAVWIVQAVSTCGDEPIYLIDVDRLLAACGLSAGEASLKPMRLEFYWGGWSHLLAAPLNEAWLLRLVLVPGWLMAGRLGALAVLGLAGAATVGLFVSLAARLGYRVRVALAGAWLLGFTLPLMQLTQHVYPGVLGVLGVAAGLRLIAGLARRPWAVLLGLAIIVLALPLAKFRLAPAALSLALAGWAALYWELPRWRGRVLAVGAVLAGLLAALVLAAWHGAPGLGALGYELRGLPAIDPGLMLLSLPAMLLDQQFGIMAYAPWLLLGLAGAARFGREHGRMLVYTLLVALVAAGMVMVWRWMQWYGGFTPPGRFLAPLLPVLALWSLPALARAGRIWRVVVAWLGLTSLGLAYVFTLIPQWRFHRRTGINNLLAWLGEQTCGAAHRFLPSFNDPAWRDMLPALGWLALALAGAVYLWRDAKGAARSWSLARSGLIAGAIGIVLLLGLVVAGRTAPTGYLPAENLRTSHSRLHGDYYNEPVQLVLRSPRDLGRTRVIVGHGASELRFLAMRHTPRPAKGQPPWVAFYLDGKEIGRTAVSALDWSPHRMEVKPAPGAHVLEVRMLSHSGRDAVGLDFLELR